MFQNKIRHPYFYFYNNIFIQAQQQTMEDLLTNLSNIITYINAHNYQLPKNLGAATRISNWICCPLACLPCFIWSTTWRLLACPFQCMLKGAAYTLSNNGCTDVTDLCISECVKGLNAPITLTSSDIKTATPDQKYRMIICLNELNIVFSSHAQHTKQMYAICEHVLDPLMVTFGLANNPCLPYLACDNIAEMQKHLESKENNN